MTTLVRVTNTNGSGTGSPRQALLNVTSGGTIESNPSLDRQRIRLNTGELGSKIARFGSGFLNNSTTTSNSTTTNDTAGLNSSRIWIRATAHTDGPNAGGVWIGGTVNVSNSTTSNNTAINISGGVLNADGEKITNMTISHNSISDGSVRGSDTIVNFTGSAVSTGSEARGSLSADGVTVSPDINVGNVFSLRSSFNSLAVNRNSNSTLPAPDISTETVVASGLSDALPFTLTGSYTAIVDTSFR